MNLQDYPYISPDRQDSFARFTLEKRLPAIIQDILDDKIFGYQIEKKIRDLQDQLPVLRVESFELLADEQKHWHQFFDTYRGTPLLEIPFFFAEMYFYRLLLKIVNYAENKTNPFGPKKLRELNEDTFANLISNCQTLEEAVYLSLYGNKADLSQIKKNDGDINLILDHTDALMHCLAQQSVIHIIPDNAGTELFSDLLLAHQVLQSSPGKKVLLYPKSLPLLVSDATLEDIDSLLAFLQNSQHPELNHFAEAVGKYMKTGAIEIDVHPFWNSPNHFTHFPDELKANISPDDVVISKGDANYRRFFEDRHIPPGFTGGAKLSSNQFALRTLKSEIISGIAETKARELARIDPDWMTTGRFAVIQRLV